jgi:hypothetical protein
VLADEEQQKKAAETKKEGEGEDKNEGFDIPAEEEGANQLRETAGEGFMKTGEFKKPQVIQVNPNPEKK